MTDKLLVGFAQTCITPKESVPLSGYGNSTSRMSTNVLSDLYATGIAVTDADGSTVVLIETDLIAVYAGTFGSIHRAVAQAVDLPVERIMVGCTHTHSAPDTECEHPSIERYMPYLQEQLIACAKQALADRKPATLSMAETKTKNISFIRHYVLEDGSYKGVNLNVLSQVPIAFHSSEPDPLMRLIKFEREGGKDIVLINWQCHPHRTGFGKFDLSADIVGVLRDEVEAAWDCSCIYFSGANGNINPLSFDLKENLYEDYLAQGKALAEFALATKDAFAPIESGKVQVLHQVCKEPFYKPDTSMLDVARDIAAYWEKNNDYRGGLAYAESKGMHSQYQALLLLEKSQMACSGVTHIDVDMTVCAFGDIAFVAVPYEMFDTNGKYVREFSPFKATVVASLVNDCISYVPSAYGYLNDCYEADCTWLTPGAGERLAQLYVKMLEKLNG